ncbi:hypothetical protein Ahy_A03g013754 isoform B [Arachis hypogaea]|uniref:U6 snRNA-associated Sm-like protein LSm1 n=2 Tax=Arachis TaxID=3817 RepID=A0A445DW49_ARAHY|nr:hypothetical protein Ahy_A03g013754 isoform B [Arachis hypogaea]
MYVYRAKVAILRFSFVKYQISSEVLRNERRLRPNRRFRGSNTESESRSFVFNLFIPFFYLLPSLSLSYISEGKQTKNIEEANLSSDGSCGSKRCQNRINSMSWPAPDDVLLSTSLATYLDKKLLVLLRDGRKLLGLLRSFDQFANVVLEGACERLIVGDLYCDVPLGLYVIRGENVVLIGELDLGKEELPQHMTCVSEAEIRKAQKAERDATDLKGTMRKRMEFLDFD